jgi:hypothetical protein
LESAVSDASGADATADPDLDAAILAHDAAREAYVYRRLAIRRRMAITAFLVLIVGGCALVIAGLSSDAVAQRVNVLGAFIATFTMSLAGIVAAYWGVGAFDSRGMTGGYGAGMIGGGFGSPGYGGGFSPSFGAASSLAAPHARLSKTPVAAGASVPQP